MKQTISVTGNAELNRLLSTHPSMEKMLTAAVREVLKQARKDVSSAIKSTLRTDPRKAYKAVHMTLYKRILGGNLNILTRKQRRGLTGTLIEPARHPAKRGGNRLPRSQRTNQVMSYEGADRDFILRFVNDGTAQRTTRYGNRGSIPGTHIFGTASQAAVEKASKELVERFNQIIEQQAS